MERVTHINMYHPNSGSEGNFSIKRKSELKPGCGPINTSYLNYTYPSKFKALLQQGSYTCDYNEITHMLKVGHVLKVLSESRPMEKALFPQYYSDLADVKLSKCQDESI